MTTPVKVDRYLPGQMITLVATIVGTDGLTAAVPTSFTFFVKDAAGNIATYPYGVLGASVASAGAGAFYKDLGIPRAATAVGSWFYNGVATGGVQAVETWAFIVDHDQAQGI